jgi:hypothetical protein
MQINGKHQGDGRGVSRLNRRLHLGTGFRITPRIDGVYFDAGIFGIKLIAEAADNGVGSTADRNGKIHIKGDRPRTLACHLGALPGTTRGEKQRRREQEAYSFLSFLHFMNSLFFEITQKILPPKRTGEKIKPGKKSVKFT